MTADMDGPWPLPTGGLWPPNHPARPTAAPVSEVRIELLGPEPEEARPCERCDDTGDMHRADGEWMGFCMCDAGRRLRYGDAATEAMKYRSTHKAMDDMGVPRADAEGSTLSLFGRITRAVVDHGNERAAAELRRLATVEAERDRMREALKWYADGEHFTKADPAAWDTVSGEPQNWWCDEAGTAMVEDGSLARMVLDGKITGQKLHELEDGEVALTPDRSQS